ncbi:Aste57867_18767 [Aphanomyces stellatus]|uniref:Aste57867_18767 protein n=1 Tax=Aphanomyces stellatus TaxID=120398 RepID=A0A485LBJ1_9STRA|nr:hypothetical protein As57867_018703 [Aphanomyces stellatus]VFT95501.1 Aste57867_18767 [Aphanomyces stellatus]
MVLSRAEKRKLKKQGLAVPADAPASTTHDETSPPAMTEAVHAKTDSGNGSKKRKQAASAPSTDDTPAPASDAPAGKKHRRKRQRTKKRPQGDLAALAPAAIASMHAISKGSVCVTRQWLDPAFVGRVRRDAQALRAAGAFTKSAIGGREGEAQTMELRKRHSECCGLFDDAEAAKGVGDITARNVLMDLIADLRDELSNKVEPLAEFMELQYLYYPGGGKGFYGKHIDQQHRVRDKPNRVVSMVLYLNHIEWDSAVDGGNLRAYPRKCEPINVDPCGGTLVLFHSGKLLHEAMPTQRDRWALVGWFMAAEGS